MDQDKNVMTFKKGEIIYMQLTYLLLTITFILFFIGLYAVKVVVAMPALLIEFSAMFFYVNFAHFFYGVGRIIYYLTKIKPLKKSVSIKRSIISVILSPLNAIILYIAVFFLALSSCAT